MANIAVSGLSKLELLEIAEDLGLDVNGGQQDDRFRIVSPTAGHLHSMEAVILLAVISYPLIQALAARIGRDRSSIKYEVKRSDGSIESGEITIDKSNRPTASGPDLNKILGQLFDGSDSAGD